MGLDMYLRGKYLIWNEDKPKVKISGIAGLNADKLHEVSQEVGYWRKANQIHNWFVTNIQKGIDDCENYEVSRNALKLLREQCTEVLKNRKKAPLLLPTKEGFFFGTYEYDKYYFAELKETIKIIDEALKLPDNWDFEYHSSW